MPTTNKEREMRIAQRRVEGFAQQFGEAHRNLARHAAFPLMLTPDLVYQIWANFVPEAPWTAVAHVLLSRLCRQVGYEMYEMDISDQNLLLRELKEECGHERFDELAEFLRDYVAQRLTDDDADTQDLREAQEWTALAYTKPDEAARKLAQKLSERVKQEDMGEILRLASLVETLAEPLVEAGFEPLLVYSRGMRSFARGDIEEAVTEIAKVLQQGDSWVWVSDVSLPIPMELPVSFITSEDKSFQLENQSTKQITPEELARFRYELADTPEVLAALDVIEQCNGNLEDAAESIAVINGVEVNKSHRKNLLEILAQKLLNFISDEEKEELFTGLSTAGVASLAALGNIPAALAAPIFLYILKIGLHTFRKSQIEQKYKQLDKNESQ